jgi:mRNA interferase MazF
MEKTLKPGDIYIVNLDPTIGDEIQKTRPVVIITPGDAKNLKLAIVVPITEWKIQWKTHPFFVTLAPTPENGIKKKSSIDCYQIRTISYNRFMKKVGEISTQQLYSIKTAIALILDIDQEHCV